MEIMISLVMLAILISAFTYVFFIILKNWNYQSQHMELREPANWAMESISQDLRKASSISLAQASRVTFSVSPYETVDFNRVFSTGNWQIVRTYTVGTASSTATVCKNTSAFTLTYYTSAGATIPTPIATQAGRDTVRLVRIQLSTQSTLLSNTETYTLRTQVRLRNL